MTTKSFLKYRNIWMGIAMLWIIWYHTDQTAPLAILEHLRLLGYGGVDIFLFASGIGCFFSLCRDPDPFRFMKRRIVRLYPTYFCFICIWILSMSAGGGLPLPAMIGNLLGVQHFTCLGNDFNWYISAIFLFYLLSPVFHSTVLHARSIWHHGMVVLLLLLLSLPFWGSNVLIVTASRVPIYYLGMIFGSVCHRQEQISKKAVFAAAAASVAGLLIIKVFFQLFTTDFYLRSYGLYWYPFLLVTPGLCILISLVMEIMEKNPVTRIFIRVLDVAGHYSFELYLVHMFLFSVKDTVFDLLGFPPVPLYRWAITFTALILCAAVLRQCARLLEHLIRLPGRQAASR